MSRSCIFPKSRHLLPVSYRPEPEPPIVRHVPITPGRFDELLWQSRHGIRRRSTRRGLRDLSRWLRRRPELDCAIDFRTRQGRKAAERERIEWILEKVAKGVGWPKRGTIIERGGWPCGFISRPLRSRVSRSELRWLSEVAGLLLIWAEHPDGWQAILGLPGPSQPVEFTNFDAIVSGKGF